MKRNTTIASAMAALALLSASGLAIAQEPPVLIGNYSANIDGAVNLNAGRETQWSMTNQRSVTNPRPVTRTFGYSWPQVEDRTFGNYSANIRIEDVRGR